MNRTMSDSCSLPSLSWFVIHTKPGEESRAQANLSAMGIETFAPKFLKSRINPFNDKLSLIPTQLFPRYIFARFDPLLFWHKVSFTRGVHKILSSGFQPLPVSDETIELIRERVGDNGYVQLSERLTPGDRVRFRQGSWQGVEGIFEGAVKESDRVRVLLSTVSYQARVTVSSEMVDTVKEQPSGAVALAATCRSAIAA